MRLISFLTRAVICILSITLCACAHWQESGAIQSQLDTNLRERIIIGTATPVLSSMAESLTTNTLFEINYLPPTRYNIKRIPGWLTRQNIEDIPKVDVALGMTSVWPTINIYPMLRQKNIRVIRVDAAQALVPNGERVIFTPNVAEQAQFFWLNPANALLMLGIIYRDLMAISEQEIPEESARKTTIYQLSQNFNDLGKKLRHLQFELDQILLEQGIAQLALDKSEFQAFADGIPLPTIILEDNSIFDFKTLYVTTKTEEHKKIKALPGAVKAWQIDDFSRYSNIPLLERYGLLIKSLRD